MKKRSNLNIVLKLIKLVSPLIPMMLLAIFTGVVGFLCAIFLSILGAQAVLTLLGMNDIIIEACTSATLIQPLIHFAQSLDVTHIFWFLAILAISRGILHYIEQASNHYVAFKLLAILRDKVFHALRRLAPSKLDGSDKGNLISIITSDIELLEVFYAHTISPVAIAFLTSLFMLWYFLSLHVIFVVIALVAYLCVGVLFPWIISKLGNQTGFTYREKFGNMNSYILDSLRGLQEIMQYQCGQKRLQSMNDQSDDLNNVYEKLKDYEGHTRVFNEIAILFFTVVMLVVGLFLYQEGRVTFYEVVLACVAMASSFGPVIALSNLANNLLLTFAAGERVLDILEEQPLIEEVVDAPTSTFGEMKLQDVSFAYDQEMILKDVNVVIPEHKVIGLQGKSGSGKSTMIKLLMRFYDPSQGKVSIHDKNVKDINTSDLRNMQSYVTQETCLFNDTIEQNIKIAKWDATHEEVVNACKKASIHDFIESLPQGYETKIGELGDRLSGGERQRIGIARAFLHDAPCILLDEPTSNLDSLHEGVILKSLKEEQSEKTFVLVSHRSSTMTICDDVYNVENGRLS
ncbi:MAG: ABC transporter ATP-binding protein/permease [Erysipelotrichaceae bacterium]|nr:ABC transporter ATP-binding protein/permease [Erysipelotrichaceae bacterium]